MNKIRWIATLAISVLMGAVAVGLAAAWLGQKAELATTSVVVAAQDVDIGSALAKGQLTVVAWPSTSVPKGSLSRPEELLGRVVNTSLARGEPVLETKLAPVGAKAGLSSIIAPGQRAVTVRVNEIVGVAGFALPGNYVDILVNTRDAAGRDVSKIILENVLVLAVAQQADRDETKPKVVSTVTVELSPDKVEKLDLARSVGQLSLVLRNQFESQTIQTSGARREDLLGLQQPATAVVPAPRTARASAPATAPASATVRAAAPAAAAAPVAPPPQRTREVSVEVIRGLSRSSADFPAD